MPPSRSRDAIGPPPVTPNLIGSTSLADCGTVSDLGSGSHPAGFHPCGGATITIAQARVTRPWMTPQITNVD